MRFYFERSRRGGGVPVRIDADARTVAALEAEADANARNLLSLAGALAGCQPLPIFGAPLHVSPLFPFASICSACGGSGEGGEESTYCQTCHGGGGHTIRGTVLQAGGRMIVIQDRWPHKFEPSFPAAVPLRKVRGIVKVPYPEIAR